MTFQEAIIEAKQLAYNNKNKDISIRLKKGYDYKIYKPVAEVYAIDDGEVVPGVTHPKCGMKLHHHFLIGNEAIDDFTGDSFYISYTEIEKKDRILETASGFTKSLG